MKPKVDFLLKHWLEIITCFLLFLMVVLVAIAVILRYIFHTGLVWSEEFVRYAYVWLIFLGSVIAMKQNAHIGLDVAVRRLPCKIRTIVVCFGDLLVMFFLVVLTVYGFDHVRITSHHFVSPVMRIPMPWVYFVFPISGILMLIHMSKTLRRHWKGNQ